MPSGMLGRARGHGSGGLGELRQQSLPRPSDFPCSQPESSSPRRAWPPLASSGTSERIVGWKTVQPGHCARDGQRPREKRLRGGGQAFQPPAPGSCHTAPKPVTSGPEL